MHLRETLTWCPSCLGDFIFKIYLSSFGRIDFNQQSFALSPDLGFRGINVQGSRFTFPISCKFEFSHQFLFIVLADLYVFLLQFFTILGIEFKFDCLKFELPYRLGNCNLSQDISDIRLPFSVKIQNFQIVVFEFFTTFHLYPVATSCFLCI